MIDSRRRIMSRGRAFAEREEERRLAACAPPRITPPNMEKGTMITLHRLGQHGCFQLNPDLIVSVESTPDTVLTLSTSTKVVVSDTPDEVTAAVHNWRAGVLADALRRSGLLPEPLRAVRQIVGRPALAAIDGAAR